MVVPIIGELGLQGAHVTLLSSDGTTKLNIEKPRKTYGKLTGGHVILGELDRNQPLLVGEAVEDVLSASEIVGGYPGIASLGAGNLPNITPPPCAKIIIVVDNDEAGWKGANSAAAIWKQAGHSVHLAIPPGDHKDWNDVLRAIRNDDELEEARQALMQAELFEGSYEVHALGMEAFMDLDFPPRRFLLKPWLTTTGLAMLDAQAGHGKTWLALAIGYAVASGKSLLGWQVEHRGRVLYVDGELPGQLLQSRLRLLGPPLPDRSFKVLSRAQFEKGELLMPDLGTTEGRYLLDQIIEEDQIDLIILDSVSTLVRSGVDNDVESWRAIQDWSLKHRARGRAVIYLHHHGRSGNPRGTSTREIVLDTRIKLTWNAELTSDKETEKKSAFKVEFAKTREFFGAEAAPLIAYLSTQAGYVEWTYELVRDNTRDRVRELSRRGMKAVDIAKELDLSKARISQIMSEPDFRNAKDKADTSKDEEAERTADVDDDVEFESSAVMMDDPRQLRVKRS